MTMKKRNLSKDLSVSELGLGCMGMSEFYGPRDDAESLKVLHRAMELGIDFLDTADTYGAHHNEKLIGQFLKQHNGPVRLATKFGIDRKPGEYARTINNSEAYIRQCCEASLERLGVDCIDLYYVHRLNSNTPIEDTMAVLSSLVTQGKIANIGLCEVSPDTLRRAHDVHPVAAVQTEYSLWTRDAEAAVMPVCAELGIGFVPYSPLGRGFLTGVFGADTQFQKDDFRAQLPRFSQDNMKINLALVDVVNEHARRNQCTAAQLSLAWILAQGDYIVPIPGTKRIKYLEENAAATRLKLTDSDLTAFSSAIEEITVAGQRYTEEGMKGLDA